MTENTNNYLHDLVSQGILLWLDVTGQDPESDEYNWQHDHANKAIQSAQAIEDNALTTFMILRAEVRAHAKTESLTAMTLWEDPKELENQWAKLYELLDLVEDSVAMAAVFQFQEKLKEMAVECDMPNVIAAIDDLQTLGTIRRDALISRDSLSVHSFQTGERSKDPLKYNHNVIKFWNVSSAVKAAQMQLVDGISMCMVRDPVALWSYFMFLIRDGENITVWTDHERGEHPRQKYMSRSAGQTRRFMNRAYKLWFPYELFKFEFADESETKQHFVGEKETGLVRTNVNAVAIKPLNELDSNEALWGMMMFAFIRDHETAHAEELSYTGEQTVATKAGTRSLVVAGHVVAAKTVEDIHRDKMADNFCQEPTGQHNWMEDRYGGDVPEELLNLVGQEDGTLLLSTGGKPAVEIVDRNPDACLLYRHEEDRSQLMRGDLSTVEPSTFGTHGEMEADREWIARYNQAAWVNYKANQEHLKRKDEVCAWYIEKVRANWKYLEQAIAKGSLKSEVQVKGGTFDWSRVAVGNVLRYQKTQKRWATSYGAVVKLYSWDEERRRCLCHVSGESASVWTMFQPYTPVSLAHLAGVKFKDLPDILQFWTKNEAYYGNPILNRLDPLDSKVKNPWQQHEKFNVLVGLSKRTFKRLVKDHGFEPREPDQSESGHFF